MARLLLDENLPRRLKFALVGHSAETVRDRQWGGLGNGTLLRRAEIDFDVFVTMDKGIPFQQSVAGLALGVVVIRAWRNTFPELEPFALQISDACSTVAPGTVVELNFRTEP